MVSFSKLFAAVVVTVGLFAAPGIRAQAPDAAQKDVRHDPEMTAALEAYVARNYEEAFNLLSRSAKQGKADAMTMLSLLYFAGQAWQKTTILRFPGLRKQ